MIGAYNACCVFFHFLWLRHTSYIYISYTVCKYIEFPKEVHDNFSVFYCFLDLEPMILSDDSYLMGLPMTGKSVNNGWIVNIWKAISREYCSGSTEFLPKSVRDIT